MPGKFGWCVPCGELHVAQEAVMVLDGDPVCRAHATMLNAMPLNEEQAVQHPLDSARILCGRGCGNVPHRGRCRGSAAPDRVREEGRENAVEVLRREGVAGKKGRAMDKLEAEEIDLKDVPNGRERVRTMGRAGELWLRLKRLPQRQGAEGEEPRRDPRGHDAAHDAG